MTDTARHTAWTDEQVEAAARAHHDALYPNIRWGAISEGYEEKRIAAMRAALAALTKATGALNMTTERERIARIIDPEAAEMVGRKTVSKMIKRANESDWAVALAKADAIIAARQPSEGMVEGMAEALRLVLPMAKGYAAANPVGSNQRYIEIAEAALSTLQGAADEGMVLVPREVTETMRRACWRQQYLFHGATEEEADVLAGRRVADPKQAQNDAEGYRAMIAASPALADGGER